MARILLGVSGGIAAYKALELVRLATAAGHAVRVVQTAQQQALRRRGVVCRAERRAGARHASSSANPLRGAFPVRPAPDARSAQPPRAGRQRRRLRDRAGVGNTIAKLAGGAASDAAEQLLRSRRRCPRDRRPRDEQPHVRARCDAGERRDLARAGSDDRGARHRPPCVGGRGGGGTPAEPPELLAACEQAIAQRVATGGSPARDAQCQRQRRVARRCLARGFACSSTAGGTREPVDSVRLPRQQLVRADGRTLRSPRPRGPRGRPRSRFVAGQTWRCPAAPRSYAATSPPPPTWRLACRQEFPTSDVLLMAAAVADFRPVSPRADKIKKSELADFRPAPRSRSSSSRRPTCSQTARGRSAPGAERSSASPPSTGSARVELARGKLDEKPRRRDRRQRHLARGHRLRRRRQRGDDHRRQRKRSAASSTSGAPPRRRSPRRS